MSICKILTWMVEQFTSFSFRSGGICIHSLNFWLWPSILFSNGHGPFKDLQMKRTKDVIYL